MIATLRFLATILALGSCPHLFVDAGEPVRVEITRDTWLSNYPSEISGSNGAAPRLKLKSIQELSILDFDVEPLRGKEVMQAKLFLKVAGDEPVERVTLSTITCDWVEGQGTNYQQVEGASSFSHRIHPEERWNNSDVTAVCIGQGGSIYKSVDAIPSGEAGWVAIEVPVEILQARLAGISFGIVLMDDTGSTWQREGEKFQRQLFPNRFVFSRDSNKQSAPYLMVEFGAAPRESNLEPPAPGVVDLRFLKPDDSDPRPRLTWSLPANSGRSILGFEVHRNEKRVPQFLVPSITSGREGSFLMPLDSMPLDLLGNDSMESADRILEVGTIEVETIDDRGRRSPRAGIEIAIPSQLRDAISLVPQPRTPTSAVPTSAVPKPDWELGLMGLGRRWTVIDALDTLLPASARIIPEQAEDYFATNHLWNSATQTVSLESPRGAWNGFQLASSIASDRIECHWSLDERLKAYDGVRMELHRFACVDKDSERVPDPLIAIAHGTTPIASPLDRDPSNSSPIQSWLFEIHIPHGVPEGLYDNPLVLRQGAESVLIHVHVRVHDVDLPKELSFLPEMNCYDLPANDHDYYRLAHRHRVVLNRLPYYQNGGLAKDCCPNWRDGKMDWAPFDEKYGAILNGDAFADSVRGPIPVECLYLAMHENWPSPMASNYNGSYWADQAFPDTYRQAWVSAVEQSVEHARAKGWTSTRFHVFLNNKVDFKERGWSRGSSPWLLDEPANFQDYAALNYFGLAYREGVARATLLGEERPPQFFYRCDISRPQWQRDTLDGLMNYAVIAQGAFREYRQLVLDRKFRDSGLVVVYGSNNPIGTNNAMAVAWCWDAWCQGADGVLPWQTIGRAESWKTADELSLFYPDPVSPENPPAPSIRLKAYCYGQQDAELLALLAKRQAMNRYSFGERALEVLQFHPTARAEGSSPEPAAWSDYGRQTPENLHQQRVHWLQLAGSRREH